MGKIGWNEPESTLISSRFRATFLSVLSNCRWMLGIEHIKDNAGEEKQ
jgi:hypothetical protein